MGHKLDQEEKEILKLFQQGKLRRATDAEVEMQRAKQAAAQYIKKDTRINIRLSQFDLEQIKQIAAAEGLPYQTLISSILHKYVIKMLNDKPV